MHGGNGAAAPENPLANGPTSLPLFIAPSPRNQRRASAIFSSFLSFLQALLCPSSFHQRPPSPTILLDTPDTADGTTGTARGCRSQLVVFIVRTAKVSQFTRAQDLFPSSQPTPARPARPELTRAWLILARHPACCNCGNLTLAPSLGTDSFCAYQRHSSECVHVFRIRECQPCG